MLAPTNGVLIQIILVRKIVLIKEFEENKCFIFHIQFIFYVSEFFRNIYEKTRWPLAIYYGLFPVKLR